MLLYLTDLTLGTIHVQCPATHQPNPAASENLPMRMTADQA